MDGSTFCETFLATLNRGDFETLGTLLHPDFVLHEAEGLPYGGTYRGLEGWRNLAAAIRRMWSGLRLEPLETFEATDGTHFVRLRLTGRGRETGISFDTTVLELWRMRDGRLLEIRPYYWDTHALAIAADGASA